MCIVYRIERHLGATFTLYDGAILPEELIAHFKRQDADPQWPPPKKIQLVDLRTATADDITLEVLQNMAEYRGSNPEKSRGLKMALVAQGEFKNSTSFARMLSKFHITAIVFNGLDTACTWLGIDLREAERILDELHREAVQAAAV